MGSPANTAVTASAPAVAAVEIAYYSMEVAIDDGLPSFSGGLGVLAGDHLRAAADRGLPVAGVTLLHRHGFFRQTLVEGEQRAEPVEWSPASRLEGLDATVTVAVCGRRVAVRPWVAVLTGVGGHRVPVYFLDTDLEQNLPEDRLITDRLYPSDLDVRLRQEAVLGMAGPLVLEALGHRGVRVHHMNEGHGALVPVGLLARELAAGDPGATVPSGPFSRGGLDDVPVEALAEALAEMLAEVRRACVFTTHTPVPAGHDRFAPDAARAVLGDAVCGLIGAIGGLEGDGTLNMTLVGMRCAGFVNGVSLRHRDVTRTMFPSEQISAITNGVHTATWAAPATAALFDGRLPDWRRDSQQLRYAGDLPLDELRAAHRTNKEALLAEIRRRNGVALRPEVLTIGIARRFAAYKRNDLVLSDPARLAALSETGPVQIVYSGKAHPSDGDAKAMVRRVVDAARTMREAVTVVFLEDYGMDLGRLLVSGSDVWLNTPAPPNEASGTSGMKAAMNGVPSLSTLDGWWIEGFVDGVTGWAFGDRELGGDADQLYDVLEEVVVPAYYKDPGTLVAMGRDAIALNGSFFSAHRMVDEYARRAYGL